MPPFLMKLLRLGPTNPIAVRLVQNGSRRQRHFYIRAGYLAALIIAMLWLMLIAGGQGALSYGVLAREGARAFELVAYLQIFLICVLAPVFMAGAIAQEADANTWDILLTTPMTRSEIVLGNLFGRLFFIIALLASSLPLFALTQYFGGVPGKSILTSYMISGCAALLVGAIAIALSVSRLAGRRAVFIFYIAVVSYMAVTAGVDAFLRSTGQCVTVGATKGVTWVTAINPFMTVYALLNPSAYPSAEPGTFSGIKAIFFERPVAAWCWGSALLSMVLMFASTLTVRSGGLNNIVEGRGITNTLRKWFKLGAAGSEHRPPKTVGHNPIAWREASSRNATLGRIVARWSFIALGLLLGIFIVVMFHVGNMTVQTYHLVLMTVVGAELGTISLVAMNMAATAVSREREDGTLDLILTTPITPKMYLNGKLKGLVAYVIPMIAVPVITLTIAGLHALLTGETAKVTLTGSGSIDAPVVLPEAGLVALIGFVPFIAFCVMVGLHWSLKSKGTLGSVIATVGVVSVVVGVVGLCGWNASSDIALVGPFLGAFSPAATVYALIEPVDAMRESVSTTSSDPLMTARLALLAGSAAAAAIYAGVIFSMLATLVRTFDVTVRKLAGIK
ncbi:MAG: ABC transporter permease subunit [Phycisphaeraceae bacterium]|nr:ABC transporter permease subunit [Phycisphaerales bacterium]MCB9859439.1 ABC transporter permease subunit [Phycisphaeraceae bacterium]